MRGAPDDRGLPDRGARAGGRAVVLADVHAVGRARGDEVGPVVEHEQRAAGVGGRAELARGGDEPVVVERLVAQLDHVDAAADRGGEELARPGVADEVQPGAGDPLAWGHGIYNGKSIYGSPHSG